MNSRLDPELFEDPQASCPIREDDLALPSLPLAKAILDERFEVWTTRQLAFLDSCEVYIYLKQAEYGVRSALEKLKERAFISASDRFSGVMEGTLLTHQVRLSYPSEWLYTELVAHLKERQKDELKAAELTERARGKAVKIERPGVITVTLRGI